MTTENQLCARPLFLFQSISEDELYETGVGSLVSARHFSPAIISDRGFENEILGMTQNLKGRVHRRELSRAGMTGCYLLKPLFVFVVPSFFSVRLK